MFLYDDTYLLVVAFISVIVFSGSLAAPVSHLITPDNENFYQTKKGRINIPLKTLHFIDVIKHIYIFPAIFEISHTTVRMQFIQQG